MKKSLTLVAVASVFAVALVACSKKTAKVSDDDDYFVPELDAPTNPFAGASQNAQNALFDIPESPVSDFTYELSADNSGVKITSYKAGGDCRIPAEIEGMPVTELASDMFFNMPKQRHLIVLVMPDTVKSIVKGSIDWGLCDGHDALKAVKLSESLTTIPERMFRGCKALEEITIPASVTSIEEYAFHGSGLRAIHIPDTVTTFSHGIFFECKALADVRLPSSLKTLPSSIFMGCASLRTVSLPDGITEIESLSFSGCKSLSSLTIPRSVTKIGDGAFDECASLESLEIPDSVTSIGERVFDKSGLVTLEIPDSVTEFNCSFGECAALTKVRLPNSIEELDDKMFHGNDIALATSPYAGHYVPIKSLQSVNLPASLKRISYEAFLGVESLTELTIPDSLTQVDFSTNYSQETFAFEGTSLNLVAQKRLRDLGYTGKFTK